MIMDVIKMRKLDENTINTQQEQRLLKYTALLEVTLVTILELWKWKANDSWRIRRLYGDGGSATKQPLRIQQASVIFRWCRRRKQQQNEYVFICGAFFIFPNKLHSAPLKTSTEGNNRVQKILFCPDFTVNGSWQTGKHRYTKCSG